MSSRSSETETTVAIGAAVDVEIDQSGPNDEHEAGGTWRHAAFHVATTIATPAAYAPLPFAVASLGWSLGMYSVLIVITLVALI